MPAFEACLTHERIKSICLWASTTRAYIKKLIEAGMNVFFVPCDVCQNSSKESAVPSYRRPRTAAKYEV